MKAKSTGFTLTEALITLAVVGVLIRVALPSLTDFLEDMQLSSNTNDLFSSLFLARSEAVKRNATVSLCKIDPNSPASCDNSDTWQSGWIAFVDLDSDGIRDTGETILETYTGMNSNTAVSSTGFSNFISYQPSGATNTVGSINVCVNNTIAQDIIINATGRPRIADSTCI